jgi:hypothetical protein
MSWHDLDDRTLLAFAVAAGPHTLALSGVIADFALGVAADGDAAAARAVAGADCLEFLAHDPELLAAVTGAGPYSAPVEELLRRYLSRTTAQGALLEPPLTRAG